MNAPASNVAPSAIVLPAAGVKAAALSCGFSLVGLARAEPLPAAPLQQWLAAGHAADLHWMARDVEERLDPGRVVPGARTVIALAIGYRRPQDERSCIARYARGRDYHYAHRDRLKKLRKRLLALDPSMRTYSCVDTGKAMEKPWAVRAGLGWVGKNGCLIHPQLGSWFTLSVMFLNRMVDDYDAPISDQCGTCDKCLRACPTQAFAAPGVVDCRKCIAYHSIENQAEVPIEVRAGFRTRAFGCDVCQEVCPFNRQPLAASDDPVLAPRPIGLMTPEQLANLTAEQFAEMAPGTPLPRIGFHGLRRNAAFALGASRRGEARATLERLASDAEPSVASAAAWALVRIGPKSP